MRSVEALIAALRAHDIATLVDVRSAPYSCYKPEFSKDALERELKHMGIRYVYLGDALGGRPNDPDCYVDDKVDYERVKGKPFYQAGIERVRVSLAAGRALRGRCAAKASRSSATAAS